MVVASLVAVPAAGAACPQALAVYEGTDGAGSLAFTGAGESAAQSVKISFEDMAPVTAYLTPSYAFERMEMVLPFDCPEGDVTGEELAACVIYQSAIYAIDDAGAVTGLPDGDQPAAERLLLPNFAGALWDNPQLDGKGSKSRPAEIFELKGCQE